MSQTSTAMAGRAGSDPFKTGNIDDGRNPDIGLMLPSGQIKFHLRPLDEVIDEELCTGAVVPVPADYYDGL